MTLVLNSVRTEVLTSPATPGHAWTVETTIKSTAGFDVDTLRALWVHFRNKNDRRMATLVETAVALKAEREAAHAEAIALTGCTCSMITGTRCARHRMQDARRATTANGALRALHRAHND